MSEPFLAEIRIVGFNFAPRGWAQCDGQILPINQHQALYSLLGTTYGGDGRTSFALPDLRGRAPKHVGEGVTQGQKGGLETVALTAAQMPEHEHEARASQAAGDTPVPTGNVLASADNLYGEPTNLTALRSGSVANVGGGQGHENMQPYLALNFCIALQGLFPPRD
jgi:microcystin-dependent protein